MRCVPLFLRTVAAHRLGSFLVGLFVVNGLLVTLWHRYSQDQCSLRDDAHKERSASASGIRGILFADEPAQEFDWKSEVRALVDTIPVVESSFDSKPTHGRGYKDFPKSNILQPLLKYNNLTHFDEEVVTVLLDTYSESTNSITSEDVTNVYYDQLILNCEDLTFLEQRTEPPALNYSTARTTHRKGKLIFDGGQTIVNVTKKVFEKNRAKWFEKELEILYKLLKMQGWPGIPRVYGVCLLTKNNIDVTSLETTVKQTNYFRYIVDRFDDAIPICEERNATDDCIKLNKLRKHVKSFRHPAIAALKIMLNIAELFQNLWLNGVFPYGFNLNELLITKNTEAVFSNVESFIFLEVSSHSGNSHIRILSDVMCKDWRQCPTPGWQPHELLFRLGQHCKEVRGHCSQVTARCWGLDASVYLCTFSKWLFHQLQMLIPSTWHHHNEINQLLSCSYKSLPDGRCDWTGFLRGIDNLVHFAEKEFEGKRPA